MPEIAFTTIAICPGYAKLTASMGMKKLPPYKSSQEIDRQLRTMLDELKLTNRMTVDDIKNIIYHCHEHHGTMHLAVFFSKRVQSHNRLQLVNVTLQDAWNYLPHKSLNNRSPYQMMQNKKEPMVAPIYHSTKTSITDLFETDLPETTSVIRQTDDEWAFAFSKHYYNAHDEFHSIVDEKLSPHTTMRKLETLIKKDPAQMEAISYLVTVYLDTDQLDRAERLLELSVRIVKGLFPPEFDWQRHRLPWTHLENRDFHYLLLHYAMMKISTEKPEEAVSVLEQIVSLNPSDNLGARSLLSDLYLSLGRPNDVIVLADRFPDDTTQEIILGKTLALIQMDEWRQARTYLAKRFRDCEHAIKELLKPYHVPPSGYTGDRITVGGEDEAYYYWEHQGRFWKETNGAADLLRQIYEERAGTRQKTRWGGWIRTEDYFKSYITTEVKLKADETMIFRVKLLHDRRTYRDIELLTGQTFEDLHLAIQHAFDFDNDHLYSFYLDNKKFSPLAEIADPRTVSAPKDRCADEVLLVQLTMAPKQKFLYLFDFGDEWLFEIEYRGLGTTENDEQYPRILKTAGESPGQYD